MELSTVLKRELIGASKAHRRRADLRTQTEHIINFIEKRFKVGEEFSPKQLNELSSTWEEMGWRTSPSCRLVNMVCTQELKGIEKVKHGTYRRTGPLTYAWSGHKKTTGNQDASTITYDLLQERPAKREVQAEAFKVAASWVGGSGKFVIGLLGLALDVYKSAFGEERYYICIDDLKRVAYEQAILMVGNDMSEFVKGDIFLAEYIDKLSKARGDCAFIDFDMCGVLSLYKAALIDSIVDSFCGKDRCAISVTTATRGSSKPALDWLEDQLSHSRKGVLRKSYRYQDKGHMSMNVDLFLLGARIVLQC